MCNTVKLGPETAYGKFTMGDCSTDGVLEIYALPGCILNVKNVSVTAADYGRCVEGTGAAKSALTSCKAA